MHRLTSQTPGDIGVAYSASLASPVGLWHVTARADGIMGLSLDPPLTAWPHYTRAPAALQTRIAQWLAVLAAFLGKNTEPEAVAAIPLYVQGTAFQCAVWQALRAIAWGQSASYQQLAASIGRPRSYRALANACGANPIAILIPCHRATASTGFGGFRWGLAAKRFLVDCEQARR
jgi:O-6-methylguanine DNA methyltransferase